MDANALFLPFTASVALVPEIERLVPNARVVVPSSVIEELQLLRERDTPNAKAAIELSRAFDTVANDGRGDVAILRLAQSAGAAVVTADAELGRTLREAGIDTIVPRDRARLELRRGSRRRSNRPVNR
ncbi:MAG TPA: hypothetical protein VFF67_09805 [Thermoplasmata archaeon]|nr:hypothetical protein [Thermoplasmata archaeon]